MAFPMIMMKEWMKHGGRRVQEVDTLIVSKQSEEGDDHPKGSLKT